MAPSQSKPASPVVLRERTVRNIIAHLTQLYLSHRTRISRAVYITLFLALINRVRNAIADQKAASARAAAKREHAATAVLADDDDGAGEDKPGKQKRKRVELNREFFRSLLKLLRVVVPGWRSKEARLLISHSFFLVLRTLISVKVAAMDGAIVKSLVKGQGREFLVRIVWWMVIAVPATFTNSMVRSLALCREDVADPPAAVVAPSRVVAQVPHTLDAVHTRQVSIAADVLRYIGAG